MGRTASRAPSQGSRLIRTPDPFKTQVARPALLAAREYGFALGGGRALIEYGIVSRPTDDVDLSTDANDGVHAAANLVTAELIDAGVAIEGDPRRRASAATSSTVLRGTWSSSTFVKAERREAPARAV